MVVKLAENSERPRVTRRDHNQDIVTADGVKIYHDISHIVGRHDGLEIVETSPDTYSITGRGYQVYDLLYCVGYDDEEIEEFIGTLDTEAGNTYESLCESAEDLKGCDATVLPEIEDYLTSEEYEDFVKYVGSDATIIKVHPYGCYDLRFSDGKTITRVPGDYLEIDMPVREKVINGKEVTEMAVRKIREAHQEPISEKIFSSKSDKLKKYNEIIEKALPEYNSVRQVCGEIYQLVRSSILELIQKAEKASLKDVARDDTDARVFNLTSKLPKQLEKMDFLPALSTIIRHIDSFELNIDLSELENIYRELHKLSRTKEGAPVVKYIGKETSKQLPDAVRKARDWYKQS